MDTPEPARPDLARLVRQHARTAQLLGVDFVPSYRNGSAVALGEAVESSEPPPTVVEVPAARAASHPAPHPSPRPAASPALASGKPVAAEARAAVPVAPIAAPSPAPRPAAASVRTPASAALGPLGDKDRATNEAALAALRARYEADAPHARFDTTFTNIVWSDGDPAARLCFVGEAPGEDEDLQGKPFVGRSGQLLDKMIVAMGLSRAEVYICNVLKTRPPGNRTPTLDEVEACRPYLLEQLSIVRPEAVVGLGLSACGALLGGGEPMSRLRGRWWEIEDARGAKIPFMPTYHPAFLLRSYSDENRAKVWSDLKMVMDRLGLVGKKPV
jgi:uracil-DNA glycosylase family 4